MAELKRQDFPPGIWVVATPIGNLADLTPRALEALRRAHWVCCEDTRRTGELCAALGIQAKLRRLDAHAPRSALQNVIKELEANPQAGIAVVTDAGTPAVSDPGSQLVQLAIAEGVRVTPFPGVSAVTCLLQASGFDETAFAFHGFFPRKAAEQKELLDRLSLGSDILVHVWFESPQRIVDALETMSGVWPDSQVVVGKEMTKKFEQIFHGNVKEIQVRVAQEIESEGALGEWAFAVRHEAVKIPDSGAWKLALECLLDAGIAASDAARRVSHRFGVAKRDVYALAVLLSQNKS